LFEFGIGALTARAGVLTAGAVETLLRAGEGILLTTGAGALLRVGVGSGSGTFLGVEIL